MAGGKYSRACWKGRPTRGSWASDNAVSIPVAAHTLQCPLPPIPYNNKHTHTHMLWVHSAKDPPRYGAQQSVPLSLTSMHPLVHSRLTLGANINSPICRHGRRSSANLQSAEALLLLADLHQRGKRGRNAGSAKSASARPELSNIGRWSSVPVHRTSSKGEVELKMWRVCLAQNLFASREYFATLLVQVPSSFQGLHLEKHFWLKADQQKRTDSLLMLNAPVMIVMIPSKERPHT